ncbi:transcriptional regulator [Mucilaginibacter limnophilus]|uniref:Transcriptional regulator n=1 Tax=Mucilaginibacter limnophilus TaxID=1932778 RepID=A0A3S2UQY7_9SPHI|nr:triple tyrosine motif-containing protein [Mucilaginibacter limnophilus]RVU02436.1 transcriptional regulator [Mucilaginibacter limnophilus]
MKYILLFFLSFFLFNGLFAQTQIGSPQIFNYTAEKYKGGVQNWDIAQDKNGLLYFGNKEGLLTFNGKFWNRYSLPNYTVIRSVKVDQQNRIFVGGQDELGYFFPDKQGVLKYHSLLGLLPANERKMADIWNIAINDGGVFFRSWTSIIHYKDGAVQVYKPETSWDFLGCVDGKILAQSHNKGLLLFDKGIWRPLVNDPVLKDTYVSFVLPYSRDTILVGTLKKGLFLLAGSKLIRKSTDIDGELFRTRTFCGLNVENNEIALGTTSQGLLIINKAGQLMQRYALSEGLQTEDIHGIYSDKNGSLWLAEDNGIDMVALNSAIKYIYPGKNKQITYSIRVFDKKLYMATSNGVFYTQLESNQPDLSLSKGWFAPLKNISGSAWNLDVLNNHLVVGHEDGLFTITGNEAKQLYPTPGTWLFQPVSNIFPSAYFIAGTYTGLQLLNDNNGVLTNPGRVQGTNESLRFLVYDSANNAIWASHPYHGVYKIQLSVDLKRVISEKLFTKADGLPSTLYNYVYHIQNRVVVATEKGIYEYNARTNKFEFSAFFKPYFNNLPVIYLKDDYDGNVWFVTNRKEVGVVEMNESKKGQVTFFPEIKEKIVGGFESIYPYDASNVFIGATRGMLHINYRKFKERRNKLKVVLGQVRIAGQRDSILFGGYFVNNNVVERKQAQANIPHLKYNQNFLHFEFASTLYNEQNTIEYSCYLEGVDKDWSVWTDKSEKDYTALPAGKYIFKVKARNNSGDESKIVSYQFTVRPVWYKSIWAYLVYIALLVYLVFRLFKWQQKKHIKEQEKLHYLNQLELDKNEKEIIRLQNEKLESDIDFKNRELANMIMHLVQRGKIIEKIKEELSVISKDNRAVANSTHFKRLLRLIADVEKGEKDWEQFTQHFNTVHTNFFKNLQHEFPDITSNELKLCAFIKMNLSTKEIAQLMNITIKGVEIARYRLRKKLSIQSDTNLYTFLLRIESESAAIKI